jgi:hypothetical protein
MIFARYFQHLKLTATFIHAAPQPDGRFWASSVLPISEHDFIETTEKVHPDLRLGQGLPRRSFLRPRTVNIEPSPLR